MIRCRSAMLAFLLAALSGPAAWAQAAPTGTSSLQGATTTQAGSVLVPGVTVTLMAEPNGAQINVTVSDSQGRFRFSGLAPGAYRVRAALVGFDDLVRGGLILGRDQDLNVNLDIALAFSTRVEAVATADNAPTVGPPQQTIEGRMIDSAPVKGDDYQALLPILPGVVRGPDGRINMKGGRPTQTGLQVSQAYVSDPTTGNPGFDLPIDAVETIDVLANPYTAEYGRFSAGMTKIETRKGTDRWSATANNFIPVPCLKFCDGKNLGIRSYDPRLIVGGPVVKQRLFLSQSVQLHDHKDRIPSLPDRESDTSIRSLDAFTRLDARFGRHVVTGTVAFYPKNLDFVNLNTFNPQPVTPNFRQRGYSATLTATNRLSDTALLETTANLRQYKVNIDGQGPSGLTITPDGNRGYFFNRQSRDTRTTQLIESFRVVPHGLGDHVIKIGIDVLGLSFTGTSESRPVEVLRADSTLSQRIEFSGPTAQHVATTDVGAFAQDGWRLNDRLLIDVGLRLDRDGAIRRVSLAPRFGVSVGVLPEGRGVLRGGAGLFYERTPLLVGAFGTLETPTVRRFAADGITPLGPAVVFVNRTDGPLITPSGRVWNLEYDHRMTSNIVIKVNHLERSGRNEFLIEPTESRALGALNLTSSGRSLYRETELTLRYAGKADRGATLTYVQSRSEGDLNGFDTFFGNFRNPIVRPNQYSLTNVDVPNRLIALGEVPMRKWLVSLLLELRKGFPYSLVNQDQEFVGLRNTGGRFPLFYTVDLNVSRTTVIRKRHVRIGLKANHVLNNATPRDVQANVDSAAFGTFYNSLVRQFGLIVEIQP